MEDNDKKYPKELYNKPIATSTNPSIDQLQAFIEKVREGYPGTEVQTFVFHGGGNRIGWAEIPKMIFEEIARSAKINNIQLTVHAPENDFQITGLTNPNSQNITEETRKDSAYKVSAVLEGAEYMGKIYGQPIKVNMHAGDSVLTDWEKDFEEQIKNRLLNDNDYRKEFAEKLYKMGFIAQEQYNQLIKNNVDRQTLEKNIPSWAFAKQEGIYFRINGNDEFKGELSPYTRGIGRVLEKVKEEKVKTIVDQLYSANENFWLQFFGSIDTQFSNLLVRFNRNWNNFLSNLYQQAGYASTYPASIGELLYDIKSYKSILENVKDYIDMIKNNIENVKDDELKKESLNRINIYDQQINYILNNIKNYEDKLSEYSRYAIEGKNYQEISKYLTSEIGNISDNIENSFDLFKKLMYNIKSTVFSDRFVPVAYPFQEVAIENGAKNVAEGVKMLIEREKARDPQNWYKNIAQYLPDIAIEESYAGAPATRPDIWKNLLNNIRNELRKTIEEYPELKNEIQKQYGNVDNYLKYKVGATLDVGHIKMFEKNGYTKDDILKWVEEIKPEIKHLHAHETQWSTDTHLPLGMGWDDVVAQELEKIKDILGNITVVHEPGSWYTNQFFQRYGPEYSYYLQGVNPTNVYGSLYGANISGPIPYGGVQFIPQYIQYTQYSPISYNIFTQLPLDLGGSRRQQTFTGEKVD